MIKGLLDQPDVGEPVFMPIVNLYYKTDLSPDISFCTDSNGGRAAGSELKTHRHADAHTHTHTHNFQRGRVKARASVYCAIFKIS